MQAPDSPFLDQKGMGGRLVLGIRAWRQGEPLNDPQGGWEGSACSPQAAPAQTKLPPAASTFSPSWAKKLWQFSAMHCLLEACRCPGVCVCVCVCVCVSVWGEQTPEGICSRSHCIIEARWPALSLRSLGGSGCPLGEKEMAGQRMSIQESLNGPVW